MWTRCLLVVSITLGVTFGQQFQCGDNTVTARCVVRPDPAAPFQLSGVITISQPQVCGFRIAPLRVSLKLQGFPRAPSLRGFHVHEFGDISNGCGSTGAHYNPLRVTHGGPTSPVRHVGDFGNFLVQADGTADFTLQDRVASLSGQFSIIGRAIVIHSGADDLGQGGNAESLRTGNAGSRLACCVIGHASPSALSQSPQRTVIVLG